MTPYVIYQPSNGRIVQAGFAVGPSQEEVEAWPVAPNAILVVDDYIEQINDWRVVTDTLVERFAMAPTVSKLSIDADGTDTSVISGLPSLCRVMITGAVTVPETEVTGGEIILAATVTGPIKIRITADPVFKPWEVTINAV